MVDKKAAPAAKTNKPQPAAAKKDKTTAASASGGAAKIKSPGTSNPDYPPDPYFGSNLIAGLNSDNYDQFVKDTDISLIMFYDTNSEWSKNEFVQAAETTDRENHAYAAVDCGQNKELCRKENVTTYPFFKLFSQGYLVSAQSSPLPFTARDMKNFVENSPDHQETYPREDQVCLLSKKPNK